MTVTDRFPWRLQPDRATGCSIPRRFAPRYYRSSADGPEHVAAHEVGAAHPHEPAGGWLVGRVGGSVAEVPAVEFATALVERMVEALVRPGNESISKDARGVCIEGVPDQLEQADPWRADEAIDEVRQGGNANGRHEQHRDMTLCRAPVKRTRAVLPSVSSRRTRI